MASVKIRFVFPGGKKVVEAEGQPGERLLEVAQHHDIPLEGTCEGQMACSTCHVIIARADFPKLPLPSEEEEDMLDFAAGVTATSRLSCQVTLEESWGSLEVLVPSEVRNMQGR